jgi:urate oxidase
VNRLRETGAVDFIACDSNKNVLFLIEVKDFSKKHPDVTMEELAERVGRKFRDTIAALVGSIHTTGDAKWDEFLESATNKSNQLQLIFLFQTRNPLKPRPKLELITLRDALAKKLIWLSARVQVVDLDSIQNIVPGLSVKKLKGFAQS